jgi:hypothetical protein
MIEQWVNMEQVPEFIVEDIDTSDHNSKVIFIIKWAMEMAGRGNLTILQRLMLARMTVTTMRQESQWNSLSILLRDAQRYLWGRTGVPRYVYDDGYPQIIESVAFEVDCYYNIGKLWFIPFDSAFGTSSGQTVPGLPMSPVGGSVWFGLGLLHYQLYDKADPHRRVRPIPPSVQSVEMFDRAMEGQVVYREGRPLPVTVK